MQSLVFEFYLRGIPDMEQPLQSATERCVPISERAEGEEEER